MNRRVMFAVFASFIMVTGFVLRAADQSAPNTLTDDEKKAGWKLLFDGKSLDGWNNFKKKDVKAGWQIKDGTLACVPKERG